MGGRPSAALAVAPVNRGPQYTIRRPTAAGVTAVLAHAAQQAGQKLWAEWNERRTWQVAVAGDDDLYLPVHQWLMAQGEAPRRRALVARTHYPPGEPYRQAVPELRFLVDGDTAQRITVAGHSVLVYVEDGSPLSAAGEGSRIHGDLERLMKPPKLIFRSRSQAGRDAVVALLRELDAARAAEKRQPGLMILDRWSQWIRRSDLPQRSMESVIVAGGVLEQLHDDLRRFRDQEADYVRRGIPWHRAYLLAGPPGAGKTSAVKAVTTALGMDLWYAQLTGVDKDVKLVDLLSEVRGRGVLLLEDVDSLAAAVSRTAGQDHKDISASGLLNALDGVATPHGLVTIMTSNHPERLDPALLRPGRIDRIFTFTMPDADTIVRHFTFFYGRPPTVHTFPTGRTSADVSEVLKRHMNDPAGAEQELLTEPPETP